MVIPPDPESNTADPIPTHPQTQDTIPMEVHHHAHGHARKKVADYFWEFLMLFLAVFCGFLAEYKLEHVIEHQRERKLMSTLVEDLQADEITLQQYSDWRTETRLNFDSLLTWLSNENPNQFALDIHRQYNRSAMRFGLPDLNEGTIQQLKNAGGLRLVRNSEVVNAINQHYLMVSRMKAQFETERMIRVGLVDAGADVMDARLSMDINKPSENHSLITLDKPVVNRLMNQLLAARTINHQLIMSLDSTRANSNRLKALIERSY